MLPAAHVTSACPEQAGKPPDYPADKEILLPDPVYWQAPSRTAPVCAGQTGLEPAGNGV